MHFRPLKDDVMKYFKQRGRYATLAILLFCGILGGRLLYLQLFQYEELYRLSENNRIRQVRVHADRGFIKDRNNIMLVRNIPGYELEVVKEDTGGVSGLLDRLSEKVVFEKSSALRRIRRSYHFEPIRVARGLNFEQVSYFMEHSADWPGVQFNTAPMRSYHNSAAMSHILGYLGEVSETEVLTMSGYVAGDIIGKSGVERQYEPILRGRDGHRVVEVDRFGRVMDTLDEIPSMPGRNIILTLDYNLQEHIDRILAGRRGSVVVLDGVSNAVLALYSAPTYNLDMFAPVISNANWQRLVNDSNKPLINRAIEGAYPPGSVYKILALVAGLKEGVVTANTEFHCPGSFRLSAGSNIVWNCWRRAGHGRMNAVSGMSNSCDVYYYQMGTMLGIDKLHEYSTAFSLGRLTGIDLPNERTGLFPSRDWKLAQLKEPWYPGETVNVSIGQGYMTTTPLQVAVMISSIFNGGTVFVPHILEAIEDPLTGNITYVEPQISRHMPVSKEVRDLVMAGIVKAVNDAGGTSWRARVEGLRAGGKTGTAQVVSMRHTENMREEDIPEAWRDHSWFGAIFPEENPRYTVVVMLEHGGGGGRSAAPIAGAIMNKMVELEYVGQR